MIDPRYLTLDQWTNAVNLTLATAAPPTKVEGDNWALWAYNMISTPSIAGFSPPVPIGYADWRSWAERFVECVPL